MAANAQSQHRCVFVGNIPYDATEEQLIQICEEVGPVVSFRLVTDRETGKPKGYGFCEYKDEETALSARRNLQGYEINGRQLRVDFAENDKNADRNREQGRGGPGVGSNVDAPKQFGGQAVLGHPSLHQPVGDSVATAAASVMAGALGSAQTASIPNQIGLQNSSLLGTDPLTRHLAKMSRSQLTEVLSEFKALATQNKEQAWKLLLSIPNLPKAIFQVEIMLGVVSPQMLQMPNIRQASSQPVQPLVQNSQTLSGLPPLPQSKMQLGSLPFAQDSRVSAGVPNQYAALQKFPTQTQIQHSQLNQNQVLQQAQLLAQSGVSSHPAMHPQSLSGLSVGQQIPVPTSSFNQQMQHPLSQNIGPVPPANSGFNAVPRSQTVLVNPQFSATGFQLSTPTSSGMLEDTDLKGHALNVPSKTNQIDRAPKLVKLNDGRATPSQAVNATSPMSVPLPSSGIPGRQPPRTEETPDTGKQATQMQLSPDLDPSVLQQLLNLTPEQLSMLPPDQQQQVMQLQQMLRQVT
ncbi:cleavage stimulating factor 64-like isoform X2 [Salvia miltiorrhiza]|uniref:cleavage stimulating factor 64-like isoform X2 n=1 Tax=Salvia miltiorrhiza TaxID=226208 RepID=UPI0025AD1DD6|nr:cleavage stimulating factor 64-like isoform X2 [Salvia miltiorrhiza]